MKNLKKILLIASISLGIGKGYSQSANIGHLGTAGNWLGWGSVTTIDLDIIHAGPRNINFFTDSIQRMTILGPAGFNQGFVGIGLAVTAPSFQLEVDNDINLLQGTFPNTGYRWQDSVILKTNNVLSNIFLGVNAGNNAGGGASNTFLGAFSGEQYIG